MTNENDADDTAAADLETAEVTSATELGEVGLAWAAAADVPEVHGAQYDRRPLPRSLLILLATVAVGGLALVAYFLGRNDVAHRAPGAAPAPAPPAAATPAPAPPSAAPPAAAPPAPPMAHGAVIGQQCDPSGPAFGYAADGSVLACPLIGKWVGTFDFSGVHEIGSPCSSANGSAVSPGGVGLVCVSSLNGSSSWQPWP